MNPYEYLSLLIKEEEDYLMHDGVAHDHNPPGRGSGRYGWGEGERILQRAYDLQSRVTKLRKSGISDKEIAKMLGFYTLDKKGNPVKDENGEYEGNIKRLQANYQFAKNEVSLFVCFNQVCYVVFNDFQLSISIVVNICKVCN